MEAKFEETNAMTTALEKQLPLATVHGLFHIAVGSHVRTLGLFFKTDPDRWKPPVPWATVLRPADDVPTSLTPDEVYQQVSEMVLKSKVKC